MSLVVASAQLTKGRCAFAILGVESGKVSSAGTSASSSTNITLNECTVACTVKINGESFLMDATGNAKEEVLLKDGSKMLVDWSLWLAPHGTTITITTDAISAGIYLVSTLPSFRISLLSLGNVCSLDQVSTLLSSHSFLQHVIQKMYI